MGLYLTACILESRWAEGDSVKEALKEFFFPLVALQKTWNPNFGINAPWQGGPVQQGKSTLFKTVIQPGLIFFFPSSFWIYL